ncbi:hypothetical protein OIV83_005583 [Microbotryomycetes sp. JL201]|nr:hypothetical protein OIV83_005583 [Microbotryomycetes sp. JL201]
MVDAPYLPLHPLPQRPSSRRRPIILAAVALTCIALWTGSTYSPETTQKVTAMVKSQWKGQPKPKPHYVDKLVCFGDSLSDDGNGPVYTEYMAQDLLLPLESLATGGASISTRVSSLSGQHGDWPVDCILQQIDKYTTNKTDESGTAFVIYAGANDAYFGVKENTGTPADVIEDLKAALVTLKSVGGRYFIIPTLPPLGDDYPYSNVFPEVSEPMHAFSAEFRERLLEWAKDEPTVAVADFYAFYEKLMADPSKQGFDENKRKKGCLETDCLEPEGYIWFDDFHPTTVVHRMLADVGLQALDSLTGGRLPLPTADE